MLARGRLGSLTSLGGCLLGCKWNFFCHLLISGHELVLSVSEDAGVTELTRKACFVVFAKDSLELVRYLLTLLGTLDRLSGFGKRLLTPL